MSNSRTSIGDRRLVNAIWRHITATSVSLLTAGQLAAALVFGTWSISDLLGLPKILLVLLWIISGVASLMIAVILYVRVIRVELRLARGQCIEHLPWALFEKHPAATGGISASDENVNYPFGYPAAEMPNGQRPDP